MPHDLGARADALRSGTLPALAGNAVSCIGFLLDEDAWACCQAARHYVDESEWSRAQRFAQAIDAARHLVGRALVRRMLAQELGGAAQAWTFALNPWGKPALAGCGIEFSISHSGRWVWAAFCRGAPVGIDIEEVKPLSDLSMLVGVLHPTEAAAIQRLPEAEACAAFYRCWTRKEAFLKALGKGMSCPLDGFQVRTDSAPCNWLTAIAGQDRLGDWTAVDIAVSSEYSMSVVAGAQGLPVIASVLA